MSIILSSPFLKFYEYEFRWAISLGRGLARSFPNWTIQAGAKGREPGCD
jgi:hypothetical protein